MAISKHHPAAQGSAVHNGNGHGNGHNNGNGSSAADIGQSLADSDITARVRAALGALPDLIALRVGVDTHDGVVTLTRSVDSRTQTEAAIAIAAQVAGVRYVNDRLIASARSSRRKAERRAPGTRGPMRRGDARDE